jgi:hypothetical protein
MMKNNNLDAAAQYMANEILKGGAVSVAESIQLLLSYSVSLEGVEMYRAGLSHIQEVLRLICEATEPEMAVL